MKSILSLLFIGIIFLSACTDVSDSGISSYTEFPEERNVSVQEIAVDTIYYRYPYRVRIKDQVALMMDLHPDKHYYHLFTYPDWRPITPFGKRGEGPQELLSADGMRFYALDSIYTLDANRMLITRWAYDEKGQTITRVEDIRLDKSLIRPLDFYRTDKHFLMPAYSGECRYHAVSHDGQSYQNVGTIPTETYPEKNVALAQAWRSFTDYNPTNQLYVMATQLGEVLEIYNLKTGQHIVKYGPGGEPRFKEAHGESFPNGIKGFVDVQVTDTYIYAIFDGLSWDERRKYYEQGKEAPKGGHYIYVFDLKGNPVRKYVLDKNILGLEIDEERKQIIATCGESDRPLVLISL